MRKTITLAAVLVTALVFLLANNTMAQKKAWVIPAKYKTMKAANPGDAATAKELYGKFCKSCHGPKGLGDGPKAANLTAKLMSFSSPEFKAQSEGAVYYESFVGRDEMPNFEKKITAESDRWALVNYIRNLK
jgi:mono/diheme cytochrome c family protein